MSTVVIGLVIFVIGAAAWVVVAFVLVPPWESERLRQDWLRVKRRSEQQWEREPWDDPWDDPWSDRFRAEQFHQEWLHAKRRASGSHDLSIPGFGTVPRGEPIRMLRQMETGQKKSKLHGKPLYKVVVDNRSVHGGSFDWAGYLPATNADGGAVPGAWTPDIADPSICQRGYHLTTDPFGRWAKPGMAVYEAEGHGAYSAYGRDVLRIEDDKLAFSSVRLLRPVDVGKHASDGVIAKFAKLATDGSFLNEGRTVYLTGSLYRVFPTEREASAAFAAAGGGKGYPAAPSKDLDPAAVDALNDATMALIASLPDDKAYAADAFPVNLAFCMAKWALSGQAVPAELDQRLAAYQAGYGVAGRAADGTLYLYRGY